MATLLAVPSATTIQYGKGPTMAPITKKQTSDNWLQRELLEKILEVKNLVDESLKLSRENGEDIRTLRKELGVDGAHGRLPQLDQAIARLDRRQEDDNKEVCRLLKENQDKQHADKNILLGKIAENGLELGKRIKTLEDGEHEAHGKNQLWEIARNLLTSSAAAAIIGVIAKMFGWIH